MKLPEFIPNLLKNLLKINFKFQNPSLKTFQIEEYILEIGKKDLQNFDSEIRNPKSEIYYIFAGSI